MTVAGGEHNDLLPHEPGVAMVGLVAGTTVTRWATKMSSDPDRIAEEDVTVKVAGEMVATAHGAMTQAEPCTAAGQSETRLRVSSMLGVAHQLRLGVSDTAGPAAVTPSGSPHHC